MSRAHSISTRRRYGMARVCDVWKVPRATVYRHRVSSSAANETQPPRRRGPTGAAPDCVLLKKICAVIASSPFSGEGLPEDLGAAADTGHPHRCAPCTTDHEGERPSGPAPSGPAGRPRS